MKRRGFAVNKAAHGQPSNECGGVAAMHTEQSSPAPAGEDPAHARYLTPSAVDNEAARSRTRRS